MFRDHESLRVLDNKDKLSFMILPKMPDDIIKAVLPALKAIAPDQIKHVDSKVAHGYEEVFSATHNSIYYRYSTRVCICLSLVGFDLLASGRVMMHPWMSIFAGYIVKEDHVKISLSSCPTVQQSSETVTSNHWTMKMPWHLSLSGYTKRSFFFFITSSSLTNAISSSQIYYLRKRRLSAYSLNTSPAMSTQRSIPSLVLS